MGMMARMRSLAPAFILSVGVLFALFMVISDSNVLEALGGRSNNVGSIDGADISYQEFVTAVDQQIQNMKTQTGQEVDEAQLPQIRDQVWDALISQKLVEDEIEKFGITVSDDEIRDIILGDNPPDFLKQSFIDSLGNFNRQLYDQALYDPQNKDALLNAEKYVRQNRLNEKLQSLLYASIMVSEDEIKRKYIDQNISMNVDYALVDLNLFPDSLISVNDNELKDYYNENLNKHKILAQRKLKYVTFPDKPSDADSLTAESTLNNVAKNFKNDTTSFKYLVEIYSSQPYSLDTLIVSALPEKASNEFLNSTPGSLIGPIVAPEGYVLYNFIKSVPSKDVYIRVAHILINQFGSDSANYQEAMKTYNEIVNGADFGKVASEKSKDPGSAIQGGNLGWFGKGAMVPEFEKASFEGKVGEIQKPVKTNYGYHIIKVIAKTDKKFVVEKIVNPITTSAATKDAIYNKANDFSFLAQKNGFENEAKLVNYTILETTPFVETTYSVPGLGANKRIIDFAFNNDLNAVSEAFKASSGYAVVMISEIIKEGVKPFDEVKEILKPQVIREKKFEKAKAYADEIKKKINGDLNKISQINEKIKVITTGSFTGQTGSVPTVGRDFAFVEKAQELQVNKISDPVKGFKGYYLMKITERSQFDSSGFSIQKTTLRDQLLNEKRSAYFNLWLSSAKKNADIVDDRYLFFEQ